MRKQTKTLITINFILWILVMVLILLGAVFVFIFGKGNIADPVDEKLKLIGERGYKVTNAILISIVAFSIGTSLSYFGMGWKTRTELEKSSTLIILSFITTIIASIVMLIMSILDIIGIWSIYPWLINFGLLSNFALVLFAFKLTLNPKLSKDDILKQIEYLKEKGFISIEENKKILNRAKKTLKINNTKETTKKTKKQKNKIFKNNTNNPKVSKTKLPTKKTDKEKAKEKIRLAKLNVKNAKMALKKNTNK